MLKTVLESTALLGLFAAVVFGQNGSPSPERELIAADRGIWDAIAGSHVDQLSAALGSDYVDIIAGTRHTRDETLKYLASLTKLSFQYDSGHAYVLSPESGYVIAEVRYSLVQSGMTATGKVLTTTVFSKEHGRWMAHLHTEMDVKP